MSENKKDLNEILEPENDDKVEMAEDSSNINEEEKKPKKEESNKFKMFRLFLIFIIIAAAFICLSGEWNPFKSSKVSQEASIVYEESNKTAKNIFETAKEIKEKNDGVEYGLPERYSPNGERPYGFKIQDYGKNGNSEGIQKEIESVSNEIPSNFGADLTMYYMINEDYAKEKYEKLQNSFPAPYDKFKIDGGEIAIGEPYGSVGAYIVVRQGTVVYKFAPFTNEDYEKSKGFMDLLGIDFELPDHEDLWQGALNKK